MLRKKGVRRRIHQSDFIDYIEGQAKGASETLKYSKAYQGYWTGEDVYKQLKEKAIPYFEKTYPGKQILFIFDNSSGHTSYAKDVLVVKRMNQGLGGKKVPIMRDGQTLDSQGQRQPFKMTNSKGIP